MTSTPPSCGAVAGSDSSNSSRRSFTASPSHGDSERKNCNRWAAASCAPTTGSVPTSPVSVLFRSRGSSSPCRYSRKPRRWASVPRRRRTAQHTLPAAPCRRARHAFGHGSASYSRPPQISGRAQQTTAIQPAAALSRPRSVPSDRVQGFSRTKAAVCHGRTYLFALTADVPRGRCCAASCHCSGIQWSEGIGDLTSDHRRRVRPEEASGQPHSRLRGIPAAEPDDPWRRPMLTQQAHEVDVFGHDDDVGHSRRYKKISRSRASRRPRSRSGTAVRRSGGDPDASAGES